MRVTIECAESTAHASALLAWGAPHCVARSTRSVVTRRPWATPKAIAASAASCGPSWCEPREHWTAPSADGPANAEQCELHGPSVGESV